MREIQRAIIRRAADPLTERLVAALNKHLASVADQLGVAADLDGALLLLEHDQTALLFLFGVILKLYLTIWVGPQGIQTIPANLRSIAVMDRLGMTRDLDGDFDHPNVPRGHPHRRHVLYRIAAP